MNAAHRPGKRRALFVPAASWLTIGFGTVVAAMLLATFDLSRASAWIPRSVLAVTLLLLVLQLATELRVAWAGPEAKPASREPGQRPPVPTRPAHAQGIKVLIAAGWIGLLVIAVWLAGLAAGSALFCLCWLRWQAGERWGLSVAIAVGLGLSVSLVFTVLLDTGLYTGLLWQYGVRLTS